MEVTIVPMRQEHTAQIAALEAACFSDPWPESILQQELENPLSLWLCGNGRRHCCRLRRQPDRAGRGGI